MTSSCGQCSCWTEICSLSSLFSQSIILKFLFQPYTRFESLKFKGSPGPLPVLSRASSLIRALPSNLGHFAPARFGLCSIPTLQLLTRGCALVFVCPCFLCALVFVCPCFRVLLFPCALVFVCPCFRVPLFSCALVFVCPRFRVPSFSCALVFVCPRFRVPLFSCALVFVCPCFRVPLFSCALVFVCPCFRVPLFSCALVFMCS